MKGTSEFRYIFATVVRRMRAIASVSKVGCGLVDGAVAKSYNIFMEKQSVKDQVLQILESNRGEIVSGQRIAETLCVTRASVWKAIKALEEDGYRIDASTKKGYCLSNINDILSEQGIRQYLEDTRAPIHVYAQTDSTNIVGMKLAQDGAPNGTVIAAERQTMGRGRIGRTFYSPEKGLYMSVILRPDCELTRATLITPAAAVATARAIGKVSDRKVGIKWVNDLYFEGKKICGILTQANTDFENGHVTSAVVGIGVNVVLPKGGFPEELRDKVGALYDAQPPFERNRLIAEIANELVAITEDLTRTDFMKDYRAMSLALGKRVKYEINGVGLEGTVDDIGDDGSLIVRENNGMRVLNCGEVSIGREDGWF